LNLIWQPRCAHAKLGHKGSLPGSRDPLFKLCATW